MFSSSPVLGACQGWRDSTMAQLAAAQASCPRNMGMMSGQCSQQLAINIHHITLILAGYKYSTWWCVCVCACLCSILNLNQRWNSVQYFTPVTILHLSIKLKIRLSCQEEIWMIKAENVVTRRGYLFEEKSRIYKTELIMAFVWFNWRWWGDLFF